MLAPTGGKSGVMLCRCVDLFTKHIVITYIISYIATQVHVDGLAQDCSISSALAMEILQFCTKPSMFSLHSRSKLHFALQCGGRVLFLVMLNFSDKT